MPPAAFLVECSQRGIRLRLSEKGGALVAGPESLVTVSVRRYLDKYEAELKPFITADGAKFSVSTINRFNKIDASVSAKTEEPFILPEVIHRPLCASVLAIMDELEWTQVLAIFRYSLDSHHIIDLAKQLRLSQDTLQKALDELMKRGAIRRAEGWPGSVCLHIEKPYRKAIEVPAVFYRGWPGNLDLSQLVEEAADTPVVALSRSTLTVNDPAGDTGQVGQSAQKELF